MYKLYVVLKTLCGEVKGFSTKDPITKESAENAKSMLASRWSDIKHLSLFVDFKATGQESNIIDGSEIVIGSNILQSCIVYMSVVEVVS